MSPRARTDLEVLVRTAAILGARVRRRNPRLPTLIFVTDPERTPDPASVAERLPRGTAILHRTFGRPRAETQAAHLAAVARRRGLVLLIALDAALAARVGAHGLHLPERALHQAERLRARRPGWIVTGAAHSRAALARAERAGVDAVLLSPALPSRSPSAGAPLGPVRFAALARDVGLPVYALGGVTARTAKRLLGVGAAGLAAVDGLRT